jgi:phosphoenolpyruvate synthase/pyruvate phosphate dikinase
VVSKHEATPSTLKFHYVTGDKRQRVVFDARAGLGTVRVDTRSHQRFRPAMEYVELLELVQAALRLEAAYGYALDIEFGFEGTRLWILQVRPVPGSLSVWRDTEEQYPLSRTGSG